jgi:hypothetical protein
MVDTEYFAKKINFDRSKSLSDYKYENILIS